MSTLATPRQKITISLPADLIEFADAQARQHNVSRSQLISMAIAHLRAEEEKRLAAEGYSFYAQEATDFAQASACAVAEAWSHER